MEELPQVVAAVRLRGVRPEGEGEVRPRLRCIGVEEQISEERLQPRCRRAIDGPAVDGQAELTKETNLERPRHLRPPSKPTVPGFRSRRHAAGLDDSTLAMAHEGMTSRRRSTPPGVKRARATRKGRPRLRHRTA